VPGAKINWTAESPVGVLWPTAWSPDGHTLIGHVVRHGAPGGIATFDLTTRRLSIITDRGMTPRLVNDHEVVSMDKGGHVMATNLLTRETRDLGVIAFLTLTVSPKHDRLYYVSSAAQANIWMVRLLN